MGTVPQPPAKAVHSFRVEDDIWNQAMKIATERRESLSDVVLRKALVRYIKKYGETSRDA